MSKDFPQMAKDLSAAIAVMRKGVSEPMAAFSSLAQASTKAGVLDPKTKELIATAIGIAVRCDGCIAFHVKAARKLGATRDEMLETIAMAIYMGGGPSMVYGAETLEAWDQFEAADAAAAAE
ncbi:MAG: carboxymuconolactone decarboxylase family protein [Alphaproteobacteria bacterium]|nr:carboxymuconolactone decarboxylase family protein [Alphaproteobacteria bacterium]